MSRDPVTVERFYTEHAGSLELNLVAGAGGLKRTIREPTVNRPGLVLSGFTRYFANLLDAVLALDAGRLGGKSGATTSVTRSPMLTTAAPQSGPTLLKLMPASTRTRSFIFSDARMFVIVIAAAAAAVRAPATPA